MRYQIEFLCVITVEAANRANAIMRAKSALECTDIRSDINDLGGGPIIDAELDTDPLHCCEVDAQGDPVI